METIEDLKEEKKMIDDKLKVNLEERGKLLEEFFQVQICIDELLIESQE